MICHLTASTYFLSDLARLASITGYLEVFHGIPLTPGAGGDPELALQQEAERQEIEAKWAAYSQPSAKASSRPSAPVTPPRTPARTFKNALLQAKVEQAQGDLVQASTATADVKMRGPEWWPLPAENETELSALLLGAATEADYPEVPSIGDYFRTRPRSKISAADVTAKQYAFTMEGIIHFGSLPHHFFFGPALKVEVHVDEHGETGIAVLCASKSPGWEGVETWVRICSGSKVYAQLEVNVSRLKRRTAEILEQNAALS
jgi:hypothetical protein